MSARASGSGPRAGKAPGDEIAAFWDEAAARYDDAYGAPGRAGRALRSRQQAVLRLLDDGSGDVLDAGMGAGRLLLALSERGWRVSGVDASEQMVALAGRRLPEARERLVCASVERLPFPDFSFDAVVATGVLEYVGYADRAISELARVLRPGGPAVLSVPNAWSFSRFWRRSLVYPLARAVKRIAPFGRPAPLRRPRRPPGRRRLERTLGAAGLATESRRHASFAVPAGALFGEAAARLAARLERASSRAVMPLAGQVVYRARKESLAPQAGPQRQATTYAAPPRGRPMRADEAQQSSPRIREAADQMPGRLGKIDDSRGIAWRITNATRRATPRLTARFAHAYLRGPRYERPVFIVGAPRSGTTMVFELLKSSSALDGLPWEGHDVWRAFHHPRWSGWDSDAIEAGNVRFGERRFVNAYFHAHLGPCRFVEKTPENALRIAYLLDLFPDATFVAVRRDPCEVIRSIINGWRDPAGRYRSYYVPDKLRIPGYGHQRMWCFALIGGWREYTGSPLPEIAFAQWDELTRAVEDARPLVDPSRWVDVRLEDLLERPEQTVSSLCAGVGIESEPAVLAALARLRARPVNALSAPESRRWRRQDGGELHDLLPRIAELAPDRGYSVDPESGDCEPRG